MTRACTHKSRLVSSGWSLSALPPKADIRQRIEHVCFVPEADIYQLAVAQSTFRTGGSVQVRSRISLRGEWRRRQSRVLEIIAVEKEGDGVRRLGPRQFLQGRGV